MPGRVIFYRARRISRVVKSMVIATSVKPKTHPRTRFGLVEGGPRQVIDQEQVVHMPVIDLQSFTPEAREVEAERIAVETGRE